MSDECISPLRRRMIEDMTVRKFTLKTQHRQYHPAGARTQEHVDVVDAARLWAVTGWLSRFSPARFRAPVRSDPKNVTPLVTESRIRWAPAAGMDGTGAGALIDRRDHPGPPIGRPVPRPCVGRAGTLSGPDVGQARPRRRR